MVWVFISIVGHGGIVYSQKIIFSHAFLLQIVKVIAHQLFCQFINLSIHNTKINLINKFYHISQQSRLLKFQNCLIIINCFWMSQRLKFKIISCSSQQQEYPVSSLLFAGSDGWQTRRFCTYPQEITLQFYGVVNIRKIQLTSDHRKISSQVDILYYVPTGSQEERFYKYGYLQFNRNQNGNTRQQKTIMVDINCLYLRFLFHKPHVAKQNFFSQIGLQSLSLYGSEQPDALITDQGQSRDARDEELNQEDQEYIAGCMARISANKEEAVRNQDFDKAELFKNISIQISKLAIELRENRARIAKSIQMEDYDMAKKLKDQINRIKTQIVEILDSNNQDDQPQAQQQNEFAQPLQDQNNNEFMQQQNANSLPNSKISNKVINSRVIKPAKQHEINRRQDYDQRVIPAMRGDKDRQKSQNDELGQQKPKQLPPVQEVQGKFIKQATFMQQFFDQVTIKKFFSQYWQYNLEALNTILGQIKKKNKQAGLIKCLTNVVKFSIKQTNFQVSVVSLSILQQMLKTNKQSQSITKPGEMQNDLDDIGRQVIRKMTDNNPKIKAAADQAFALMISSLLYGVQACSISLTKNKSKLSSKQIATRMVMISKMIDDYGLASGPNTVPVSTLDYAIENLNHSAQEVRKNAVSLLTTAYRRDKAKTQIKISDLKDSIQKQIRGEDIHTPPRNKKK